MYIYIACIDVIDSPAVGKSFSKLGIDVTSTTRSALGDATANVTESIDATGGGRSINPTDGAVREGGKGETSVNDSFSMTILTDRDETTMKLTAELSGHSPYITGGNTTASFAGSNAGKLIVSFGVEFIGLTFAADKKYM